MRVVFFVLAALFTQTTSIHAQISVDALVSGGIYRHDGNSSKSVGTANAKTPGGQMCLGSSTLGILLPLDKTVKLVDRSYQSIIKTSTVGSVQTFKCAASANRVYFTINTTPPTVGMYEYGKTKANIINLPSTFLSARTFAWWNGKLWIESQSSNEVASIDQTTLQTTAYKVSGITKLGPILPGPNGLLTSDLTNIYEFTPGNGGATKQLSLNHWIEFLNFNKTAGVGVANFDPNITVFDSKFKVLCNWKIQGMREAKVHDNKIVGVVVGDTVHLYDASKPNCPSAGTRKFPKRVDDFIFTPQTTSTTCTPNATRPCGVTKGECKEGTETCKSDGSGWGACQGEVKPTTETCNGKDDNCDGMVDNGLAPKPCTNGCGNPGTLGCVSGQWETGCSNAPVCNSEPSEPPTESPPGDGGIQDGGVDGGTEVLPEAKPETQPELQPETQPEPQPETKVQCVPGDRRLCYTGPARTKGVGACSPGQEFCGQDSKWSGRCDGQVLPGTETCNGKDDDCDGKTDNVTGKSDPLTKACGNACNNGQQTCQNGSWQACDAEPCKAECKQGEKKICEFESTTKGYDSNGKAIDVKYTSYGHQACGQDSKWVTACERSRIVILPKDDVNCIKDLKEPTSPYFGSTGPDKTCTVYIRSSTGSPQWKFTVISNRKDEMAIVAGLKGIVHAHNHGTYSPEIVSRGVKGISSAHDLKNASYILGLQGTIVGERLPKVELKDDAFPFLLSQDKIVIKMTSKTEKDEQGNPVVRLYSFQKSPGSPPIQETINHRKWREMDAKFGANGVDEQLQTRPERPTTDASADDGVPPTMGCSGCNASVSLPSALLGFIIMLLFLGFALRRP